MCVPGLHMYGQLLAYGQFDSFGISVNDGILVTTCVLPPSGHGDTQRVRKAYVIQLA